MELQRRRRVERVEARREVVIEGAFRWRQRECVLGWNNSGYGGLVFEERRFGM